MQPKIKASPILEEYHVNNLKEHKFFLRKLLAEEKAQKRLRELYDKEPADSKKKKRLKKKIKKRKKGRQRLCFDYETAKAIVRSEGIMSLTQYKRWYQMNRPVRMPKNPQRAYKANWTGWGDFLGFYNEYTRRPGVTTNGKGKYRSFEDARAFARSLNLRSIQEWKDYTKTGKCPIDIPHRPDIVYSGGKRKDYWLSWKDFLGYGIQTTSEKIQQVMPVIYIAKRGGASPNNVYIVNVIPGGKAALTDHINKLQVKLICAYYVDIKFDHREFIRKLDPYTYGGIDEFVINNIYEVISVLDDELEKVH